MTSQPSELEKLRDEQGRPLTDAERIERLRAKVAYLDKQATETVYAHVERTVHVVLDAIEREIAMGLTLASPDRIKHLAEAVQALSSWPQFNPMNAVDDYRKLAEYEVEKAIKARLPQGYALAVRTGDVVEAESR